MNRDQMRRVFSERESNSYRLLNKLGLKRAFYAWYQATRKKSPGLEEFRDLHKGQRCFILGGGPSLKSIDPAPLAGEHTFGVNGLFLIYDWLGFEPTYYAVEDFLVYEDRFQDIKDFVRDSTCFFPLQFECPGFNRPSNRYYRGIYEFDEDANWPEFSEDPTRMLWIGGTVTYICMQLAHYMGFEEVVLLGMDHSYSKPHDLIVRGNDWTSQSEDPNHFHPDYFGEGYRWHDPRTDRMEKAYAKARAVFERDGRRIVNATVGGKLESFERVDYDSLFGG
ncbi:MAG: hypothetical protein ACI9QQ_000750 [Myxococcota bacterium]|jgi:hypothetical protein